MAEAQAGQGRDERVVLGRDEVRRRVDGLSSNDWGRLREGSRCMSAYPGSSYSQDALLNAAIEAALALRYKWPVDVQAVPFLWEAMRSIASLEYRRLLKWGGRELPPVLKDPRARIEQDLIDRDLVERVRKLFAKDVHASLVLQDILDGLTRAETVAGGEISNKEYGAARKRIQRTLSTRPWWGRSRRRSAG